MANVPDHLVPSDGLTNSNLRFAGFNLLEDGTQIVRFEIKNEHREFVASYNIEVGRTPKGNADTVIADGHAHMRDVLRQWLYEIDKLEQHYRKQANRTVTAA
jgi:hypothetical protein